jgi:diguanylate cyclase (GGDEF)-like protein/PAS domain S-box-containing protein
VQTAAESDVLDIAALRIREATIAMAVPLTFSVSGLGLLYVALTWSEPHRTELLVLFGVSALSSLPVYKMRQKIVRSRWREALFLGWTLGDFAMLVIGALADGGTHSPLIPVFFLPVVYSATSYPLASVVVVGVVGVLSFDAVAITAGRTGLAYHVSFAFALICTAAISAWQAQNHKRQNRALATASRTDPLTGVLNRRGFQERAEAEIAALSRSGGGGAIVMLDIDKFKPVNDVFGHAAGDELLCWVAQTLQASVRPGEAIARFGGDEFAVLLREIGADEARERASAIGEALASRAPASLGVALFPEDGTDLETLTRAADNRLYGTRRSRYGREPGPVPSTAVYDPAHTEPRQSSTFGPIDLWRAALEAMPTRGRHQESELGVPTALLDEIDASVVATDMTGKVISWNSAAEALYGWSREEAVGRNARELMVPEDTAEAERLVIELSRDGRWDGELKVKRKDGTPFTAYVRNRLVLDASGAPSAIVGVAVDISERVRAETELLQSRNYAQAVTECMGEGLFTVSEDGLITYINRAAEQLLEAPEGALRGRHVATVLSPREDGTDRRLQDSPIGRALARGVTVRVSEDEFVRARGTLPVAYTAAPFHTTDGVKGAVVIFQDVAERRQREEESRRNAQTLAVMARVEEALASESFVLHAQPIVDLRTGRTVRHELLLRLLEPDGAVVMPGEFLPVCEQTALIGEIDWWVIRRAAQLAGAGSPVQANISARSVGDPDVLEHIERCVEQYGVAPGNLVFEITETAVVEGEHAARKFVERLHALGCGAALDDFGTGYGTLTYLKQIPVDHLKLDIEFVRDVVENEASRHVIQAVVALARDFGLQTVGEGVEDGATLELLRELGVDFAQGFHIARPAPFLERPDEVEANDGAAAQTPPAVTADTREGSSRGGAVAVSPAGVPARGSAGRDVSEHPHRRLGVRRVERLDRQLRERHVDGGAESADRRYEGEFGLAFAKAYRHRELAAGGHLGGERGLDAGIAGGLFVQRHELRVARDRHLPTQPREQVRAPFGEVRRSPRHALRVQRDPDRVGGRLQQPGRAALDQRGEGVVGRQHVVAAVDDQRRIGLVSAQETVERTAHGLHRLRAERPLGVGRRVPRGEQQSVALTERHLQRLREAHDGLAAGLGTSRLDEAQVPRGDARLQRELELAERAARAPLAQQGPERGLERGCLHSVSVTPHGWTLRLARERPQPKHRRAPRSG